MSILLNIFILAGLLISAVYLSRYGNKQFITFKVIHFFAGVFITPVLYGFLGEDLLTILGVLIIGVLWEIWELAVNFYPKLERLLIKYLNYRVSRAVLSETLLDLALDVAGAIFYLFFI